MGRKRHGHRQKTHHAANAPPSAEHGEDTTLAVEAAAAAPLERPKTADSNPPPQAGAASANSTPVEDAGRPDLSDPTPLREDPSVDPSSDASPSLKQRVMDAKEMAEELVERFTELQSQEAAARQHIFETSTEALSLEAVAYTSEIAKRKAVEAGAGAAARLSKAEVQKRFKMLTSTEEQARGGILEAYTQSSDALMLQIAAATAVVAQVSSAAARFQDAGMLRQLMAEEAAARKQIFEAALNDLKKDVSAMVTEGATKWFQAQMAAKITTPENCIEAESSARESVVTEEFARRTALEKGMEATRRAQAIADWAKAALHRALGNVPEPTTVEECVDFEVEARAFLEARADRALGCLRGLQRPPDYDFRDQLFARVEECVGDIVSRAITTFVEALGDPKSALNQAWEIVIEMKPRVLRLTRAVTVELLKYGLPVTLQPQVDWLMAPVYALPDRLLEPAQAQMVREVSAVAWQEGSRRAVEYYEEDSNPCMPAKCVVM